jgi:hypothetical protein
VAPAATRGSFQVATVEIGQHLADRGPVRRHQQAALRERKGPSPKGWEGEGARRARVTLSARWYNACLT